MFKLFKNLWQGILEHLDWLKIVLSFITSIYGVSCGINLNTFQFNHPLFIFIQWILNWHALTLFIISSILLFIISIVEKIKLGSYSQIRKNLRNAECKLEILNNNIKELLEGLLMSFANSELNFSNQNGNNERISLYLLKEDSELNLQHLYPIARYASNPEFRKTRRSQYSINKGCIAKAYNEDWCYDGNVDENKCIEIYGYTTDEYNAIRMKSRTYAAITLKNIKNNVIGVLVVESIQANWMSERTLKTKLFNQAKYYAEICTILNEYIDSKVLVNNKERNMPW